MITAIIIIILIIIGSIAVVSIASYYPEGRREGILGISHTIDRFLATLLGGNVTSKD